MLGPFVSGSSGDDDFVNQASGPLYAGSGLLGDLFQVEAVEVTPQEQNALRQLAPELSYGQVRAGLQAVSATLKKSTGRLRIVDARISSTSTYLASGVVLMNCR